MKILREIPDDEMIAVFLQAEIYSDRWSSTLLAILRDNKIDRKIIEKPNIHNEQENNSRREVLTAFRGYGKNTFLFHNFPPDVVWKRALVRRDEVEKILYINWDYWTKVTKGSRQPKHLAKRIQLGEIPDGKELQRFKSAANILKTGQKFPTIIVVAKNKNSRLVVLEGHVRLSAYAIESDFIPHEMEVIIGFSKHMQQWENY